MPKIQIELSADHSTYKLAVGEMESDDTPIGEDCECEINGVTYLVTPIEGEEPDFEVYTQVDEDEIEIVEIDDDEESDEDSEESDEDEEKEVAAAD